MTSGSRAGAAVAPQAANSAETISILARMARIMHERGARSGRNAPRPSPCGYGVFDFRVARGFVGLGRRLRLGRRGRSRVLRERFLQILRAMNFESRPQNQQDGRGNGEDAGPGDDRVLVFRIGLEGRSNGLL